MTQKANDANFCCWKIRDSARRDTVWKRRTGARRDVILKTRAQLCIILVGIQKVAAYVPTDLILIRIRIAFFIAIIFNFLSSHDETWYSPIKLNQCFGVVLFLGGSGSRNFVPTRSRLRLLIKENIILDFFKTDYRYELSKILSNTCTSTYRSYLMFTLEKTSNVIKFHIICVNY